MAVEPINKYLGQDYRTTLGTSSSPPFIETEQPVTPVVDILRGLPKPNAKQSLKFQFSTATNAIVSGTQLATPTSKLRIYYLGCIFSVSGSAGIELRVGDATTGDIDQTLNNTECLTQQYSAGNYMLPLPTECKKGLRYYLSGNNVATAVRCVFFWIEEIVE